MRTLLRLAASVRHRNDWHSHPRLRAVRYLAKTCYAPSLHARWLSVLDDPLTQPATLRDTHLFERWQHQWVSRGFSPADRLRRLLDHHRTMHSLLAPWMLDRLWAGEELDVGSVTIKDGRTLHAYLAAPILRCLEGELVVGLRLDDRILFSMTVTLCPETAETLVGCIQGPRSETGLADVRELTRQCHGLRPKDLLLSLVRALGVSAGTPFVRGPGNRLHVFWQTQRVKACYDTFWLEAGATMRPDGLFEMPAVEPFREPSMVASKHRSAFRAKEILRQTLTTRFAAFALPHPAEAKPSEPPVAPLPAQPIAA